MKTRPIRTEADYEAAVERIAELMDARAGTPEGDELAVLAALVDRYEEQHFPIEAPTPLAAIRFRMEQGGLSARDLEPYIGSRARVSEVLSGRRALSIDMIRALHEHLGIPLESLVRVEPPQIEKKHASPSKPVIKLLRAWGLMGPDEGYESFLGRALARCEPVLLRKTRTERTNAKADPAALSAWCAGVQIRAAEIELPTTFRKHAVTSEYARSLAALSARADGPWAARSELLELGVCFVVLPHLPGTYLDGAAMLRHDGAPIIAMTLRHDRIDNFWFVLLHELAHIAKHLNSDMPLIFDDLDLDSVEAVEAEADDFAGEALIPGVLWRSAALGEYASTAQVVAFANEVGVSPAIVAGRWQREWKDYRKFSKLLGRDTLRAAFRDEWPKAAS